MSGVRFLLDTDAAADHLRGVHPVTERVQRLTPECAISCVTLAELTYGVVRADHVERNRLQTREFVSSVLVLPLDSEVADHFARIKADLRARGLLVADFDLVIASTALAHGLTLVTSNLDHYDRIPDLTRENWRAAQA